MASAQVSPGPLATAHSDLEGSTNCYRCHAKSGGRPAMEARCLACHREIAWMKNESRGTHARYKESCVKCHPDHGGRDFALIAWPGKTAQSFDHREAGWELTGAHRKVECRTCHQARFQHSGAAALMHRANPNQSWLGLDTGCVSCHQDPHRAQLGNDCARCHDANAWKPASRFDHARTRYPLTGMHTEVACARCHLAPSGGGALDAKGQPVPQYRPLPFGQCSSCHQDPHRGGFGSACASCHRTTGWSNVNEQSFDHDHTRYPLRGKHRTVACARCHDPKSAWGKRPLFAHCADCHRDAHAGSARIGGQVTGCEDCHSVSGFARSTMLVAAHDQTDFPLREAHASVACASCHTRAPAGSAPAAFGTSRVRLELNHAACTDCHGDPHHRRFTLPAGAAARTATRNAAGAQNSSSSCLACHDQSHFVPARYDASAHAASPFPLEGAHLTTPCSACHRELAGRPALSSLSADSSGLRQLRFADARRRCAECHANPHGRQFEARAGGGACNVCHDAAAFVPASRFDHGRDSGFRLEGAHARTPCSGCHQPIEDADHVTRTRWKPVPRACEACHGGTNGIRDGRKGARLGPDLRLARMMTTREASHVAAH